MREWDVPGYTEVRVLGSGGFGDVVLARDDATGTLVAVKYLRSGLLADPEFAEMFRAEARVLASLDDPHVVRLYEYVESPSGAAIVMELVDGVSLRVLLSRQGKTTAEAALVVLQGSLLGLAAAHARGVVHRDYKPENVLVDGAGASKLTDFGIAARSGDRGIAAGTLAYAPPEQFGGGPASPAGDVYAATATFYECLAGHPPFTGATEEALLRQHESEPVPLEPVPEPLRQLVTAGMAKDPRDRPADAASFVAALQAAAGYFYGQDWEERGRSHLGEAALLLAALWPSGGAPAVQGQAVEQVHLSQDPQATQDPQHPGHAGHGQAEHAAHAEHLKHVEHVEHEHAEHVAHLEHMEHVEHVEHVEHAGQSAQASAAPSTPATGSTSGSATGATGAEVGTGDTAAAAAAAAAPPPSGPPRGTRLRRLGRRGRKTLSAGHGAGAIIAIAILIGVIIGIVLVSGGGSGSPTAAAGSSSSSAGSSNSTGPGSAAGSVPVNIPVTASSSSAPVTSDVYVQYHDGKDSSADLKGTVPNPTAAEVVRLYAQQFPFTSAPIPAGTVNLDGGADFSFSVTPTLATHYQVKLFSSATATAPQAVSAISTIYVVETVSWNVTHCSARPSCQGQYVGTVYVPPSTMSAELNSRWYVYIAAVLAPPGSNINAAPASLPLANGSAPLPNGTGTISAPQQTGANSYSATINDSYNWGNHAYTALYWLACSKDTEAQDGLGLPGSHGCGAESVANGNEYLG